MKLPKELYVHIDRPANGEEYLVACETVEEIADLSERRKVGKYVLEKLLTVETEVKIRNK